MYEKLHRELLIRVFTGAICLVIGLGWVGYYGEIKERRIDVFTSESISAILDEHQPDLVVSYTAPQLWYLLGPQYARREIIDYQTEFYDLDYDALNNKKIIIFSHVDSIDSNDVEALINPLIEKNYITEPDATLLRESEPIYKYENWGSEDFDFYNVTTGTCNGMFYAVYQLSN